MRSALTAAAVLLAAIPYAHGQTYTSCNPLDKTDCPTDPALGTTLTTDFTKGADKFWTLADATKMSYTGDGANFVINTATDAPTISSSKYIFFGKVSVTTKAAPGTGIISSFILESDDLDEIDWEWLGSTDSSVESNFFGKGNTTSYNRAVYHNVADPIGTWHTYTVDWTSSYIKWYIDSNLVRTLNYGDALALEGKNFPQTPMRVKMGNWVGCADQAAMTDPSTQGTCEWAGGAANFDQAPFTMFVKSVTIQDYGCAQTYTYGDQSGSFESIKSSGGCGPSASSSSSAVSSSTSSSIASSSSSSASSSVSSSASSSASSSSSSSASSSASSSSSAASSASSTAAQSSSGSSAASTTGSAATTLATTASGAGAGAVATASGTSSPSSSATPLAASAANGMKPQHKFGVLDFAVMALGLGLGYLVM
ncbi:glycoside hydrolase family 16 protein [Amorphotheca resinae ATCC 22711]|uniref:Crh-like protein n=1 Tax=Amorphotheca resinae ATCC 22711 TaxID=857342 RepID=A0A2T3AY92_AMORE|nr:glycoside hydrolase family 16 protein [Amorphotheca resinae ATCC 22711]PSS15039.1 glycoside hydrolase family 16 protein [Amorphotheca resinae ATCC 22711]